jgi:hypothetical protein
VANDITDACARKSLPRIECPNERGGVSLQTDIRELSDLRTAEIAAPSASDYERVGVNNYWIASSENAYGVVRPLPGDQKDTFDVGRNIVIRNHGGALRSALNAFLPGRNFVVYEMENSGGAIVWGVRRQTKRPKCRRRAALRAQRTEGNLVAP